MSQMKFELGMGKLTTRSLCSLDFTDFTEKREVLILLKKA